MIVFSVVIGGAIVGCGLLDQYAKHMVATLSGPLWMVWVIPGIEMLTALLIILYAWASPHGALSAVFVILFGLVPSFVGSIPVPYIILWIGESLVGRLLVDPAVTFLSLMWLSASMVSLVRALRFERQYVSRINIW